MKKIQLISTLLSLFLLVPASITWAQVTKTLNGTVRYQSGMSETKFPTPNGYVVVTLPQSMSGSVITGTVSAEPAGKTEKEKNKNLKEMVKFVVNLDGQKIPISATPTNFDWLTHLDRQLRTPIELFNVSGAKVAELSLPPVLSAPATGLWQPDRTPLLTTPSNVLVKGDALNIYTDHTFSPGEKFVLTDSKGQVFTVKPVCLSANQAVITVPQGAVPGNCKVRMEEEEASHDIVSGLNNNAADFKLIDINLTSPNTNLRPGQQSFVTVSVHTGKRQEPKMKWEEPDKRHDLFGEWLYSIDLRNLNPNTVTMEGGNLQRVYLASQTKVIIGGETTSDSFSFQLRRNITGNAVGTFSVSATLHEDYNTSNDPFRPQLNVLNTPEDFNAWANGLKKDLAQFARVRPDFVDNNIVKDLANIQRAIENMPACASPEQLDECKAVAYSLVQPLHVPKGAANTWLSSYEAFKSAISRFAEIEPTLIEYPTLINGLDFMERISYRSNDASMTQDVTNARQLVNTINGTVETKENINQLNQALSSLRSRTDQKLMSVSETNKILDWSLSDLLFSTYCFNKRTRDGIDPMKSMVGYLDPARKILRASPEYQQKILSSLQAVPTGNGNYHIKTISETMTPVSYDIRLMPFERTNTFDSDWWAEHLIETVLKKDTSRGNIITTTKDSTTGTYYVFYKDAKCEIDSYRKEDASGVCVEETQWDAKEQKSKPTGRYQKITCYKGGSCKKGTDFCTEAYLVSCITQIFLNANCTKPLKTFDFKHFSCL